MPSARYMTGPPTRLFAAFLVGRMRLHNTGLTLFVVPGLGNNGSRSCNDLRLQSYSLRLLVTIT